MATNILTIGQNCSIFSFEAKQRGYGRQAVYVELRTDKGEYIPNVFLMEVFPNVKEHFQDRYGLWDDAYETDKEGIFTDNNGSREYTEDCLFNTSTEMLNAACSGKELEIEDASEIEEE